MANESTQALEREYRQNQHIIQGIGLAAAFVLGVGAVFYHIVEKLNWLDAFYYCTITLTTVGYGDITPHTSAGKLFTMFYVIIGIGIIGAFANYFLKNNIIRRELKRQGKQKTNLED